LSDPWPADHDRAAARSMYRTDKLSPSDLFDWKCPNTIISHSSPAVLDDASSPRRALLCSRQRVINRQRNVCGAAKQQRMPGLNTWPEVQVGPETPTARLSVRELSPCFNCFMDLTALDVSPVNTSPTSSKTWKHGWRKCEWHEHHTAWSVIDMLSVIHSQTVPGIAFWRKSTEYLLTVLPFADDKCNYFCCYMRCWSYQRTRLGLGDNGHLYLPNI